MYTVCNLCAMKQQNVSNGHAVLLKRKGNILLGAGIFIVYIDMLTFWHCFYWKTAAMKG